MSSRYHPANRSGDSFERAQLASIMSVSTANKETATDRIKHGCTFSINKEL